MMVASLEAQIPLKQVQGSWSNGSSLATNLKKCGLLVPGPKGKILDQYLALFQNSFSLISIPEHYDWQLLGSPEQPDASGPLLHTKIEDLKDITDNLELIEIHQAFFTFKNCLSILNLCLFTVQHPCFRQFTLLEEFDIVVKANLEKICNVSFGIDKRSLAHLPIRDEGLGFCSAADLSLP